MQRTIAGAVQTESTKIDDVLNKEMPRMQALARDGSSQGDKVAHYADDAQKNRNEIAKFSHEARIVCFATLAPDNG